MGDETGQSTGQDTIGQIQGALQSAADSAAAFNSFATTIETIMAQLGVVPGEEGTEGANGATPANPLEQIRTQVETLQTAVMTIRDTRLPAIETMANEAHSDATTLKHTDMPRLDREDESLHQSLRVLSGRVSSLEYQLNTRDRGYSSDQEPF